MDATQTVLGIFREISDIPRASGNEAGIREWLRLRAIKDGFAHEIDAAGNILIRVPATPGYEAAPCTILQGHMDMVCLPIQFSDGKDGWLRSNGSTLGADDGIGIATALALVQEKDDYKPAHPALELLFTVEEETNMGGAQGLKSGFLSGSILLNLDSEDEGVFINGCAGGEEVSIDLPLSFGPAPFPLAYSLKVSGLLGGHSGVDIDKNRASANKLLARTLDCLQAITPLALGSLKGGSKDNAIATDAEASFAFAPAQEDAIVQAVKDFETQLKEEYKASDPGVTLTFTKTTLAKTASVADTRAVIKLLMGIPHGPTEWESDGSVKTSDNLAIIGIVDNAMQVRTSQRSTDDNSLIALSKSIIKLGVDAGGNAKIVDGSHYPGWSPNDASPLRARCVEIYHGLYGKDPIVRTIHAGLECGVIGATYPGLDMISLGATIQNPHSTGERLSIPTVQLVWDFLVTLLKN